jgi:uncharacterized LabA/DUF88 family protein
MSDERVMVFIDGSNLLHCAKTYGGGVKLDYRKLVDVLVGDRNLVRPYFYGSIATPPNPKQKGFYGRLRYLGFHVIAKPLRPRGPVFVEKGVDVALVTDLLSLGFKDAYDVAVVVSCDPELVRAIEEVKSIGKRVEIAGFDGAAGRRVREAADRFITLDEILDMIRLEEGERGEGELEELEEPEAE